MTKVRDIMTRGVAMIPSDATLQDAAKTMERLNVGSLPVCEGEALVGMVTDRDITIRGVAAGRVPQQTLVSEVMTHEVRCCSENDTIEEVMEMMGDAQVRRLAVLDDDRKLAGIVALGDLATRQPQHTDITLREISERSPTP
jgi:CBS domain-containing protein